VFNVERSNLRASIAPIGAVLIAASLLGGLSPLERTAPPPARFSPGVSVQLTSAHTTAEPPRTAARVFGFGISSHSQLALLNSLGGQLGRNANVVDFFDGWTSGFPSGDVAQIAATGAEPQVTWEPWDYRLGINQDTFSLQAIAHGTFDSYITSWAQHAAQFGQPVMVRFAHEMNGHWYPWGIGVNGNTAADYVAAWRHVHDLFVAAGATNVQWVWCPNVGALSDLAAGYPGSQYVDYVGVDGYNWGDFGWWTTWSSPRAVFNPTLQFLSNLHLGKPVIIDETGAASSGGPKPTWITNFVRYVVANPLVIGFVWSEFPTPFGWGLETSPSAVTAMKVALVGY